MSESPPASVAARPDVDAATASRLAAELFGMPGATVRELGSHQDRNYLVEARGARHTLKIANRMWGRAALEAQHGALEHLAACGPTFRVPRPVAGQDGAQIYAVELAGEVLQVRMLEYVEGTPLSDTGYLAPGVVAEMGRLAGEVCQTLASFDHPGLDRHLQWDLRQARATVQDLLPAVPADQAGAVRAATAGAARRLGEVAAGLPVQAVHGDMSDDNVVGHLDRSGRLRPDGIIDFGDLCRSWRVGELAVTLAALLRRVPDDPLALMPSVVSFDGVAGLSDGELRALWPLVVLRAGVLVVSGEQQARLDPDNPSATGPLASEWQIFRAATAWPLDLAEAAVRAALGRQPSVRHAPARAAFAAAGSLVAIPLGGVVDLSATSTLLHGGRWAEPGIEPRLLADAVDATGGAVTRFGEARLTRTRLDAERAPATCPLGVDALLPAGTALRAPWDGRLTVDGDDLILDGVPGRLRLGGVVPDRAAAVAVVAAGTVLATAGAGPIHIRASVDPEVECPELVPPAAVAAWRQLAHDPAPLLGRPATPGPPSAAEVLDRRRGAVAALQEHYYEAPVQIERGWRHHLFDTGGRAYLDMVNNVAAIGHGHPGLADAVERQLRTFNSNSRFHYSAIADFCARLAALAPSPLDTVFLVNSGSEAVDLALRMAQVVTGRTDVVAVREAYHGWTMLADAVTTSLYDNPSALESRPDWVHLVPAPNPYRGQHRGGGSGAAYAEEVRHLVEDLAAGGRPPAAFICEPVFGNAGGVLLPEGFLAGAYDSVRRAGGLCIADEVQVGYGRLGEVWWAFELQGVTPDVITVAKAMGNGYPLGAVITTRAIADGFGVQGSFFSSAGGSPASCAAGMAVLDAIEEEGLQANAAAVGRILLEGCRELMDRHPLIGAVHGMGLYLGVELVVDRDTLEPATAVCAAVCDRLLELGVIVQPTGERANVLKMKPPLCLSEASARFFVRTLDRVLAEGW